MNDANALDSLRETGNLFRGAKAIRTNCLHHMALRRRKRKPVWEKGRQQTGLLLSRVFEAFCSPDRVWKFSTYVLILAFCICILSVFYYGLTLLVLTMGMVSLIGLLWTHRNWVEELAVEKVPLHCDCSNSKGEGDWISMEDVLASSYSSLSNIVPGFKVSGDDVLILDTPGKFYMTLREQLGRARSRITLASLYIGNGDLEHELLKDIGNALEMNGDLKVNVLIDGLRGTRGGFEQSSHGMLMPLLKKFPDRTSLSLYHSPDLSGLKKRLLPARYNELIGVAHMKAYVFDDALILSGANLSHSYFTNRQDRYILINNASISGYFDRLIDVVCSFSYKVDPHSEESRLPEIMACDPVHHSDEFKKMAKKSLQNFIERELRLSQSNMEKDAQNLFLDCDTIIYPLIQMAPFDIRQDELVTSLIMSRSNEDSLIYLTSGYFNFTDSFMDLVICSAPKYAIITASPEANGFSNAHGLSGYIPHAYVYLAKCFLEEVQFAHQDRVNRIDVLEYCRPDWTYHAKGIWFYLPNQHLPSVSLIGSPNFGYRSLERDLEAQIMLVTRNETLRRQMHQELEGVSKYCERATETLFLRKDRRTSFLVQLAMFFGRSFL
jgi:CDP-diacylglycerol---glycerol-3-phosphate 3-phosphatidyltransferase